MLWSFIYVCWAKELSNPKDINERNDTLLHNCVSWFMVAAPGFDLKGAYLFQPESYQSFLLNPAFRNVIRSFQKIWFYKLFM